MLRFLALFAALVVVGCSQRRSRPDDEAVIETVLLHFLQDAEYQISQGNDYVILLRSTPEKTGMVMQDQINVYLDHHRVENSLIEALYRRNKGAKDPEATVSNFGRFQFDKRVKLQDDLQKGRYRLKLPPGAKGYFQCYAPGYSSDRKTALVRAWIGPSAHGAIATYLVERVDNQWRVKWREFAYFV